MTAGIDTYYHNCYNYYTMQQQIKGTATISAMDLRKEPGRFLDRVELRGESFVIERAGRAKAALVPLRDYEDMQRRIREARERFGRMTEKLQAAFVGVDAREIEQEIERSIQEVRTAKKKP